MPLGAPFPSTASRSVFHQERGFDTIVALALIEHLNEPQLELAAWSALLGKSGTVMLTTPHKSFRLVQELGSRAGVFSREAADEHEEMFDRASLTALGEQAGLCAAHHHRFLGGANQLAVFGWEK